MINILEFGKTVFESDSGKNVIREASYCGAPCYAVTHVPSGHTEITDKNKTLLQAIVARIKRTSALCCARKKTGRCYLMFQRGKREKSISLRAFVYAKYHQIGLGKVRGKKIMLVDNSAVQDGILDIRSRNLYAAGDQREDTDSRTFEVIENPYNPFEKFIAIRVAGRQSGATEYIPFEPELLQMLSSSTYCSVSATKRDRLVVVVHYKRGASGHKIDTLAKFVLLYLLHFDLYRDKKDGIRRFIRAYPKLSARHKEDAAHINGVKWNSTCGNLMFMPAETNLQMSDDIKKLHNAYTTLDNQWFIRIEYGGHYFLCKTSEDYLDWQRVFLGKSLTGNLQKLTVYANDSDKVILTPCGEQRMRLSEKQTPEFDVWLRHRQALLSLPDSAFMVYNRDTVRTLPGALQLAYVFASCALTSSREAIG